ncbi:MAG TPA: zinc-binding dehydrogenase [Thermoanaerobaculia bacterium]|nr:zinc-binding dehydrogenase [Thermoanaerobaculia bacterium]
MDWLGAGRLSPYVSHRVPLAEAARALQIVKDRQVIGKVVLI